IVLQLLDRVVLGRTIGIAELSPTGDAGFHAMTQGVVWNFLRKLTHKLWSLRTRANKAHVTSQDVENLRQLVYTQLANEGAHARVARIPSLCPHGTTIALSVQPHAAELEYVEGAPTQTHPRLPVKYRRAPPVLELDRNRSQQHHWQRRQENQETGKKIQSPRRDRTQWTPPEALAEDHPARVQHVHAHPAGVAH